MNGKEKPRLYGKNKKVFLDGLKKYQARGIPILIDGEEARSGQLEKILETGEDGSFYMGDYIWEQEDAPAGIVPGVWTAACREPLPSAVREAPAAYHSFPAPDMCRIRLKEIRFDKVYH